MRDENAPMLAQKLEDYLLETETARNESKIVLEDLKSSRESISSAIHEKNVEEKCNENTTAEPSENDVEETVEKSDQQGCISSKSSLTSKSTQNQAQMTEEDEVFGDLCEADQLAGLQPAYLLGLRRWSRKMEEDFSRLQNYVASVSLTLSHDSI